MEPSDLSLLVALDALLQESSVSRAAHRVGLSTPAMSHALARIRERLGDPILVRAGRGMVLTPRAQALKPRVRSVVAEADQVFAPDVPFAPATLDRTFVILATDYVLLILGSALDRMARHDAPKLGLRFVPNTLDDAAALREGTSDLAVGIYGDMPPELKIRQLLTDRFVCVLRREHPMAKGKKIMTPDQFAGLEHVQVAPRGQPGGYLDEVLRARGLERRVARAVPYFHAAVSLVVDTDYVLTISERVATRLAPALGLNIMEPPLELSPYALSLVWHPRMEAEPAHRWLRELFVRAAGEVAGNKHQGARKRLDPNDPTTGTTRGRKRA